MALNTKMRMMLNSHLAERLRGTKASHIQAITLTTMALLSGNVSAENALLDNISGYVSVEGRYFPNDPAFPKQSKTGGVSLSISPEYKYRTDDDNATFTFNPFYRWDDTDDNRSHGDIRQLDFVTAKGDWEFQVGIGRKFWGSKFEKYSAAVGGFEYTLPTISESGAELGILAEYHLDSRGQKPSVAFQKDLFVGARLALNDEDSSELLAGAFVDLDNSTKSIRVEGSRRIGNGLKLNLEAQVFTDVDSNDAFNSFSEDDHIKLELQKFF